MCSITNTAHSPAVRYGSLATACALLRSVPLLGFVIYQTNPALKSAVFARSGRSVVASSSLRAKVLDFSQAKKKPP